MLVASQPCKDRIGRNPAGFGLGVSVNACRDAWESDRRSLFLGSQPQGVLVARTKQVRLALPARLVNWPNGMNHVPGQEAMPAG